MKHSRSLLAAVVLLAFSAPTAAAAAELSNPWTIVFDVECDLDGNGTLETSFQVASLLNGTSTGRILGTTSQANVLAGTATLRIGGEVVGITVFPTRPGAGLNGASCVAAGSFIGPGGGTVDITIAGLRLQITPEGGTP
jgi:hypothetical protein